MSRAFIFPGQGSQFPGMGKDLFDNYAEAREVFEEVDDVLNQKLSQIIFEGPDTELNLTENTQPALMTVSVAVMRVLEKQGGFALADYCAYVAGHSLGEYSALTAAGSLSLADSARLLKLRGQSMQQAVPVGQGAMAALLGLELDVVKEIATAATEEGSVCDVANDNSPGQVVVSGHKAAIDRAMQIASERGAKKAVPLPVSAPFHSRLMAPAAERMREALAESSVKAPAVPVVANVSANAITEPDEIRRLLTEQVTGMVRWCDSVDWMSTQGVNIMTEIGAGKVLSGLVRRINRDIACSSVGTPEQIDELLAELKG